MYSYHIRIFPRVATSKAIFKPYMSRIISLECHIRARIPELHANEETRVGPLVPGPPVAPKVVAAPICHHNGQRGNVVRVYQGPDRDARPGAPGVREEDRCEGGDPRAGTPAGVGGPGSENISHVDRRIPRPLADSPQRLVYGRLSSTVKLISGCLGRCGPVMLERYGLS